MWPKLQNNWGESLRRQGTTTQAISVLKQAYEGQLEQFGPGDPRVLTSAGSYALALSDADQLNEAQTLLQSALEACKQSLKIN